ncbi:MAG TPA: Ig-like domain-containing protein [Gemmatimonadaceae bacterium]|nr:Ig-like domain-containing protein [Gemmatimonadaceae bacterium]
MLRPNVRAAAAILVVAYIGCKGDTTVPDPSVATTIAANSAASLTGPAGGAATPAPSVIVKDQNGSPMAGAPVTFTVVSGGGSVSGATATTDASGVATVGWTLGPSVGENVLSAVTGTLPVVTFTATSTAGAAASVTKNGGDNQTAVAGTAVAIPPSVLVKDANGNAKSGVTVTFTVLSGGGSVTGGTATTNASGIAQAGSWSLGSTPGPNSLSATVAGLTPVTFTATGTPQLCAQRSTYTFGTVANGTLAAGDCVLSDGSLVDLYNMSIPQAGAYVFRQGATFNSYLILATSDGMPIGENDDELDVGPGSSIKALIPSGNYILAPTSLDPGVTGTYEIASSTTSTEVSGCEEVFIARNVTTNQNVTGDDCNFANAGATPIYGDGYLIFIPAGATITINMTSSSIDPFLQLVRLGGTVIAQNDNIDTSTTAARITYTAPANQNTYYAIIARAVPSNATGAYTLTVQ